MAKVRDSGMPAAEQWESYFDAAGVLESLGCRGLHGDAVEFGCGYGTFTIPAAQRISGTLHALDIDPLMVAATATRVSRAGLKNVRVEQRDFVVQGCGRETGSVSMVLLFNILHIEDPVALLKEACRVLAPGGLVGIIHWNYDARTPRGPPLTIRPRPEQCRAWGEQAGLRWVRDPSLPGSPWHWGQVLAASD
ncbi:MAG TPA: class I SAM-dependent methyltransferase [Steroidobacteraceae bacterium]|nr:class I SAM-dependent methyltransferase [Steroidobacteraceae bacterium]